MTLDELVNSKINKPVESVDTTNLNQCFDLAHYYSVQVLNLPQNIFAGLLQAYELYLKPTSNTKNYFDFIKNTPDAVAKKGDIVVWGRAYGFSGHVAVVLFANVDYLVVFSQNDPTGAASIVKTYNYNYVLGFLRPKVAMDKETVKSLTKKLQQAVDNKSWE